MTENSSKFVLSLADNGYILGRGEKPHDFLEVYEVRDKGYSFPEEMMRGLLGSVQEAVDDGTATRFKITIKIKAVD